MGDDRRTVQTADGRRLDVLVAGPRDGLPLVFHHGTPGGLIPMRPLITAATACGLRTVMYTRPGYGGPTARPRRSVAAAPGGVLALLDRLRAAARAAGRWAGGGPRRPAWPAAAPARS